MKAHYFWPARRFDELSREEIDTRAWTATDCTGDCDQGRACKCCPKEAGSSVSEFCADSGNPARPGLSWAAFRETCREPLAMVVYVMVACIVIAAMKIMGPQQ